MQGPLNNNEQTSRLWVHGVFKADFAMALGGMCEHAHQEHETAATRCGVNMADLAIGLPEDKRRGVAVTESWRLLHAGVTTLWEGAVTSLGQEEEGVAFQFGTLHRAALKASLRNSALASGMRLRPPVIENMMVETPHVNGHMAAVDIAGRMIDLAVRETQHALELMRDRFLHLPHSDFGRISQDVKKTDDGERIVDVSPETTQEVRRCEEDIGTLAGRPERNFRNSVENYADSDAEAYMMIANAYARERETAFEALTPAQRRNVRAFEEALWDMSGLLQGAFADVSDRFREEVTRRMKREQKSVVAVPVLGFSPSSKLFS